MFGAPFAVARVKGFFKQVGIDVTGFITSTDGGTTIRNALASEIPSCGVNSFGRPINTWDRDMYNSGDGQHGPQRDVATVIGD